MIKGCINLIEINNRQYRAYCPYYEDSHCTHDTPAVLTSTLYGAHPADCPIAKEDNDEK